MITKLTFSTTNNGKFNSLQKVFNEYNIKLIQEELKLYEIQSSNVQEIAANKVKQAYERVQKPCIAQDTGFFIDALDGFPGPYVKYALSRLGVDGFLKLRNANNPHCRFIEALVYHDGITLKIFTAPIVGTMSESSRGRARDGAWSGLWHIFIPEGCNKTIAEMTEDEHNAWRAIRKESAIVACAKWLTKQ